MRESEAGSRVVVQGVVSSGSCRVVGNRGSAVRGKWAEIFRGGRSFCLVTFGVERGIPEGCERGKE